MDTNECFDEAKKQLGISVVIPALNEEKAIEETVRECTQILSQWGQSPFEVIVVDDGSNDKTGELAQKAGAIVVRHPARAGYGRSLKDGIRKAQYDTIVITDADSTYPIAEIPRLLAKYFEGFDMVVGARTGENYRQSFFKSTLRRILKWIVEWVCEKSIPDINSGLRVFSKSISMRYFHHLCDTFSFTTSITLAYMMTGRFVAYLPIDYFPRVGSSHVRLFSDTLKTSSYILRQLLYFDPLKIFLLFSGCWLSFGALCFIFSAITSLNLGYYMGVFSVFGAFTMLGLGLLAEQIRQLNIKDGGPDDCA